jgi:hypothetical protein
MGKPRTFEVMVLQMGKPNTMDVMALHYKWEDRGLFR